MEKIVFTPDDGEAAEFYVLEQTTIAGRNYILVTDTKEGDGEALILKDTASPEDSESVYEIVTEDEELSAVAEMFEKILDDVEFEA